jgi:tight adherence protein B
MLLTFIFVLIFSTVALVGFVIVPAAFDKAAVANVRRGSKLTSRMEQIMNKTEAKKMSRFFVAAPLLFGIGCFVLFPNELKLPGFILGIVLGFMFPGFYMKAYAQRMKDKFDDQLIDALMIMSSSFRGGLSLIQAMEAVVDEMPDPINKEFGIVLGENKMGVSLEEAMNHLYNRMPSPALQQMITSILLARETGGNLPVIFQRIVNNIRENKKIQQNLNTLTVQGKIQGAVMALLPIAFGFIVFSSNKRIFMHMLHSDVGRVMLIYAIVSELIGAVLIWKISTFRDF